MDRLDEIKAALHRGTWSPTMAPIHDIDWLVAEVERLRKVEQAADDLLAHVGRVEISTSGGDYIFRWTVEATALDNLKLALRAALAEPAPAS